jgi:hypothetical protein
MIDSSGSSSGSAFQKEIMPFTLDGKHTAPTTLFFARLEHVSLNQRRATGIQGPGALEGSRDNELCESSLPLQGSLQQERSSLAISNRRPGD